MRACGSRPEAGSSSSSTRGSCTRARARPRRCFCPRDSTRAGASARSASPTSASRTSARADAAGFGIPYSRAVTASVSRELSEFQAPRASGIHPSSARAACGSATGSMPSMRMDPASGARSDASIRRSVVLPEPFGPTRPVTRPARALSVTLRTACTSPKALRTPCTTMPASAAMEGGEVTRPTLATARPAGRGGEVRSGRRPRRGRDGRRTPRRRRRRG